MDQYTIAPRQRVESYEQHRAENNVPIRDVIQRVDASVDHGTLRRTGRHVGDQWMTHKGKGAGTGAPMAEKSSLYHVVQPASRPVERSPKPDRWIDTKGKRSVPGPEQRRERASLFPIVQPEGRIQDAYVDGNALGDAFLEQVWYQGKGCGMVAPRRSGPEQDMWRVLAAHEPPQSGLTMPRPKPRPGKVDFAEVEVHTMARKASAL